MFITQNSNATPFDIKHSATNASIKFTVASIKSPEGPKAEHKNTTALKQKKSRVSSASPKSTQPCNKKRKISHAKKKSDAEEVVEQSENLSAKQISIVAPIWEDRKAAVALRDNYAKYLPKNEV